MTPLLEFDRVTFTGSPSAAPFTWRVEHPGVYALAAPGTVVEVLVRTCIGLMTPAAGAVRVLGLEPYRLDRRSRQRFNRQVAPWLLPPALVSNLPIRTSLLLPLLHDPEWTRTAALSRVGLMVEICFLGDWADTRPADVPADVRNRASLARALAGAPQILVADDFARRTSAAETAQLVALCREHVPTVLLATSSPRRLGGGLVDSVVDLNQGVPEPV
jgi:ABC-type transporter Mla maintaining outer membrane lipid asymmetry ATPase subunit MlaF